MSDGSPLISSRRWSRPIRAREAARGVFFVYCTTLSLFFFEFAMFLVAVASVFWFLRSPEAIYAIGREFATY